MCDSRRTDSIAIRLSSRRNGSMVVEVSGSTKETPENNFMQRAYGCPLLHKSVDQPFRGHGQQCLQSRRLLNQQITAP